MGAGALEYRAAEGGEGSGVGDDACLHALDDTVLVTAHGEVHVEGVALRVNQDRLGAGELHLHRDAGDVGDQGGVMLDGHVLLAAEAAADELVLDEAVIVVDAEHRGALV